MRKKIKKIIEKENITFLNLLNPKFMFKLLYKYKYIHFFLTGMSGVGINLFLTWFFTTFFFGLKNYFYAYLIGLSANLIYNFILHTLVNFKTKEKHLKRFIIFIIYSLVFAYIQATIIKLIVPLIGLKYYLFIIGSIIFSFSFITFIIFKLWLFKEKWVRKC